MILPCKLLGFFEGNEILPLFLNEDLRALQLLEPKNLPHYLTFKFYFFSLAKTRRRKEM